jgi:hypothetical protein
MDFHLATPDGDVYLFSSEGGQAFCLLVPPAVAASPVPEQPRALRRNPQSAPPNRRAVYAYDPKRPPQVIIA